MKTVPSAFTSPPWLAIILAMATSSLVVQATIVAHWTFDESSGTVAHDSAGSFHGTLSPTGSAFVSGGISGNAMRLTQASNGYVTMGNVLGFTTGDFSFVAWVKMNPGDTTADTVVFGKHQPFSLNGYFLAINTTGGGGQIGKAFFYQGTVAGSPISTTTVNDGNWHQIVTVYRAGGNKSIYVDGAPAENTKASEAFVGNPAPFLIGGTGTAFNPHFTGLIDDVQVYNHALSDGEIDFVYQHPGQVSPSCVTAPPGLVSWWQAETNAFDGADGNTGVLAGNTSYAAGRVGQAFVFDGVGDAVRLGSPLSLQLQSFTIETWIKRASTSVSSRDNPLYGNLLCWGGGGYALGVRNDGQLYLSQVEVSSVGIANAVTDTNWHHVAVTKTGSIVVFFVDGVAHPAPAYNPSFTFGSAVAIGAQGDSLAGCFFGSIDELSVYNRALTATEIQSIYSAGSQGKCRIPTCSEQLATVQDQLATVQTVNAALQTQLAAANVTNAALQAQLTAVSATNAALTVQLAAANNTIASLQTQLAAANNAIASLQAQLATCNNALAAANQTIQTLQNEIQNLLLPLELLTQNFRTTFHDPQFVIDGDTPVEQMQNLVTELLDLPRGQKQALWIGLGGHLGNSPKPRDGNKSDAK